MTALAAMTSTPLITALRHPRKAQGVLTNALYLLKTNAPSDVLQSYAFQALNRGSLERYRRAQADFNASLSSMRLSTNWFSGHVPFWLSALEQYQLESKPSITALEIGSWEGLSSVFLLESLPQATLTCVDTWEGSDEQKGHAALDHIERNFDHNLSKYKLRLTKYKGTSISYFSREPGKEAFDLIYVDGSHHCDDVLIDAVKGFERLRVGGIMIFDDYLWRFYPRLEDNPAAAINAFLRLKKGCYKVVNVYWQLIIEKTAESRHQ